MWSAVLLPTTLNALFRPLPEGGLLWFHHVLFLFLILGQSQKSQHLVQIHTLPEKKGPSTFACKSKNASGRIGIFLSNFCLQFFFFQVHYEYLLVAMGLQLRYDMVCINIKIEAICTFVKRMLKWTIGHMFKGDLDGSLDHQTLKPSIPVHGTIRREK